MLRPGYSGRKASAWETTARVAAAMGTVAIHAVAGRAEKTPRAGFEAAG
ncbi:hypothetical protein [Brevibacterium luteolum]|nr:hypothetical protein [Brevibacterium luteolum]MCT1891997.1 hypothetical protein [Brevibacterium luteolum]